MDAFTGDPLMPSQLDLQCTTILYAASSAELGLVIKTNDPYKARQSFYKVRQTLGDADLAGLQIRVSPNDPEHEIWLLRRAAPTGFNFSEIL